MPIALPSMHDITASRRTIAGALGDYAAISTILVGITYLTAPHIYKMGFEALDETFGKSIRQYNVELPARRKKMLEDQRLENCKAAPEACQIAELR